MGNLPVFKLLAIAPKVPALLSMAGSASIVKSVVSHRRHRKMTYHRIIACLSCWDFLSSLAIFLGTWMIPPDPKFPFTYMAAGNQATCNAQGFSIQAGQVGVSLYQIALAVYYVIEIRQEWPSAKVKRVEMVSHVLISLTTLLLAAVAVPLQLYNSTVWICYIYASPVNCRKTNSCVRGEYADLYTWAFLHSFLYLSFLAQLMSLFLVYCKVLQTERRNDRYLANFSEQAPHSREKSRRILGQAILYSSFFFVTFTPLILVRIMDEINKRSRAAVVLSNAIMLPFQGFWNYIIYNRPRYLSYRKRNPDAGFCSALSHMLFCSNSRAASPTQSARSGSLSLMLGSSTEFFGSMKRAVSESMSRTLESFQGGRKQSPKKAKTTEQTSTGKLKPVDTGYSIGAIDTATNRATNEASAALQVVKSMEVINGDEILGDNGRNYFLHKKVTEKTNNRHAKWNEERFERSAPFDLDDSDNSTEGLRRDDGLQENAATQEDGELSCCGMQPMHSGDCSDPDHSQDCGQKGLVTPEVRPASVEEREQDVGCCQVQTRVHQNNGAAADYSGAYTDASNDDGGDDLLAGSLVDLINVDEESSEEIVFDWEDCEIHASTGTPWI